MKTILVLVFGFLILATLNDSARAGRYYYGAYPEPNCGYVVRRSGHGPTLEYYLVYQCAVPGHYAPYDRGYYRKGLRVRG